MFSFTADAAGLYLFEVSWWSKFKGLVGDLHSDMVFRLYRGSTMVDSFEYPYMYNTVDYNVYNIHFTFQGEALAAGNTFTISGDAYHGLDTQATPARTQTKVNVLRIR